MEAPVGIEPTMAELQSTALPLCYGALIKTGHFKVQTGLDQSSLRGAILGITSNKSTTSRYQHLIEARPA